MNVWPGSVSLLLLMISVFVSLVLQGRVELELPNLYVIGSALLLAVLAGLKGARVWWLLLPAVFCVWYLWLLALGH